MGSVYAEITLKNAGDVTNVERGIIKEPEVRQIAVKALVDTGAMALYISEDMRQQLGLAVEGIQEITLADERKSTSMVTEPVRIYWNDRVTALPAYVVEGIKDVLLGVIPLEAMDLIVDPTLQELRGAHGDKPVGMIKSPFPAGGPHSFQFLKNTGLESSAFMGGSPGA